ncbi:GCN5 family acetyltransferase [Microbacterium sp. JAI119]|uniref:GCN5 family acetyltransferase n=1 Tax=Microbacterium sp. JAI119 TaxID=2723062 RepID=UPI0015CCE9E1|nr:GCN5 family acetyltransferase [Microbacterium sp. JAI119]NYF28103.1 hypothetical protein [Microbacterium sp. JAI119]
MIVLTVLEQTRDYVKPFEHTTNGFTTHWWRDRAGTVGSKPNVELISFVEGEQEVARAEVHTRTPLHAEYAGLSAPHELVEVVFFEVRADRRCDGAGTAAVRLLEQRYQGQPLFAFSENADAFWDKVGWRHFPRTDGDLAYRPLFVSVGSRG